MKMSGHSIVSHTEQVLKSVARGNGLRAVAAVSLVLIGTMPSFALDPSKKPGQNFDLSPWTLQLPIGSTDKPDQVSGSDLTTFSDEYFFTNSSDGAMGMKVIGGPPECVTTKDSKHCRTELRENDSWSPSSSVNKLKATLEVDRIDNDSVVIGQVHIDDSISTKPAFEMYYDASGNISVGVENDDQGTEGQGSHTSLGHVDVGTKFTYEIDWEKGDITISINGKAYPIGKKSLGNPKSYFKAGCYNQGTGTASVHFFALSIEH